MVRSRTIPGLLIVVSVGIAFAAQGSSPNQTGGKRQRPDRAYPPPVSAWAIADLVLGNATDRSVDLVIHPKVNGTCRVEFGGKGSFAMASPEVPMVTGKPILVNLDGLRSNTEQNYRLRYQLDGNPEWNTGPSHPFQTQRAPGAAFTFFVQGDSHPERTPKMHVPELYERALKSAAAARPDFFICLGDDFSVDTLRERTRQTVEGVYRKQVPYLGLVGQSAPIFLVNGNHEQAAKANLDGSSESLGVWAQNARNVMFAQPAPNRFYTGNAEKVEHIGYLRNYYAWTWGDALFVVIDPYWHSNQSVDNAVGKGPASGGGKRNRNLWDVTLGDAQYKWLQQTLSRSKARFKFVFSHHVLGTGRGGVELARLYEWGGFGPGGTYEFASRRPGWAAPIHKLFVDNGVTAFFQGHDHIFVHQELDGVVYQTCPVPADASDPSYNADAYRSGDKVPGAGLVKVSVRPDVATVEFVRSLLPSQENDSTKHGSVAFRYTLKPRGGPLAASKEKS